MMEPESRGFLGGNLILPVAGVGLLVVIALFLAFTCGGDDDGDSGGGSVATPAASPTAEVAAEAATALAQFAQTTLNAEYSGDCSAANVAQDAGKVCSVSLGERQGVQAYEIGMTFSEFTHWAFVAQRGGVWEVVSSPEITAASREVPGIPWPLSIGSEVVITTGDGSCLNIRTEPGGNAVDCLSEGTRIKLAAGPQTANDIEWWRVDGRDGWVAAQYLRFPDATQDPTPTVGPSNGATPAATGTPAP